MKAHQSKPQHGQNQLSDETKFKVVSLVFTTTPKLCYSLLHGLVVQWVGLSTDDLGLTGSISGCLAVTQRVSTLGSLFI